MFLYIEGDNSALQWGCYGYPHHNYIYPYIHCLIGANMETDRFGMVAVKDVTSFVGESKFPMPWLSACERCSWAVVCQMNEWDCEETQTQMEGE